MATTADGDFSGIVASAVAGDEVAFKEARRLGGLRRRREGTVAIAYDLPGLETVEGIRRVLDVVVTDALGNDAPVPRLRVLIAAVTAATRLLETGELQSRLTALEAALADRREHTEEEVPWTTPAA